jgi:DNA adenine methylase
MNGEVGSRPRPFLKWAGGKSNLLHRLRPLVTRDYENYIEPFVGGGALFFDLSPYRAILSDLNTELMNCYRVVRDEPHRLLRLLETMSVDKETFYAIRRQNPEELHDVERAARLIYLNKTCYNGLYRVNKKGQFNTPFGRYEKMRICNVESISAASRALQGVMLLNGDFEYILSTYAKLGDFIYLDPPYPAVGIFSDFKRYTKEFFVEEDHVRLAEAVKELDRNGCKFVLSNAMHPLILKLYARFRKIDVEAPRYINCRGGKRGSVPELLITNIEAD